MFAKKTLIAHLGAHKTGTSLIQGYFKDHTAYYEDLGIRFLTRGQVSPYISWGKGVVREGDKFRRYLSKTARQTKAKTILFSNENILGRPFPKKRGLYPGHARKIEGLKQVTEPFNTKIVLSIRPQADFLQSYYLQRIHEGHFMTFEQFLEDINLKSISWRPMVTCLQENFGAENVTVMDFNLIKTGQMNYVQRFLDCTMGEGIPVHADYDLVSNPSISDRGLHMALLMNPLLQKGETGLVRQFLQENFSNRTEPRPNLMRAEIKTYLAKLYDEEYQKLTQN